METQTDIRDRLIPIEMDAEEVVSLKIVRKCRRHTVAC